MFRYTVFVTLLVLLNSLVVQKCHLCNAHMSSLENPHFKLTLKYSATESGPVSSAKAKIYWNGNEISSLQPSNTDVHTLEVEVKAVQGQNKLTIAGASESTGVIVDNVKLVRQGTEDNIVRNGDFQKTALKTQSSTFQGWKGLSSQVSASKQNPQWLVSKAALITSDPKKSITQLFKFDRQYRLQTEQYHLSFLYAAPIETELSNAKAKVTWNDETFDIAASDREVKIFKAEVKVGKGKASILQLAGVGSENTLGLTISNITLIPLGGAVNIVVNGDFSMPRLKNKAEQFNYLPGWEKQNKIIKIGQGTYFNPKWKGKTEQVIILGNKENTVISQQFDFGSQFNYIQKEQPYFTLSFDFAALDEASLKNSVGEILIDNQVIAEFIPDTQQVQHFNQRIVAKPGVNSFKIRPKQGSSIVIGNFKIGRMGKLNNLALNGDFSLPSRGSFIPGWKGSGQIVSSSSVNSKWQNTHVIKLASKSSNEISQSIQLDKEFRVLTNRFQLQLEFAATQEAQLEVPLAWVSWNGQDFPLSVNNRKVQIFKTIVVASRGQNQLTLTGQGKAGQGLTIDNVKLVPLGSSGGALSNGDFESPNLQDDEPKKTFHLINDWQGTNIQLGNGEEYNENWPKKSGQVLSLATGHRTIISRALYVAEDFSLVSKEPNLFKLSFSYAAYQEKPLDKSGGQIFWNKVLIGDIQPQNYKINKYSIVFKAKEGENSLFIKGAGGIQAYGLTIDDVKLVRLGTEDNLVENGKFQDGPSPGWTSIVQHAPLINHHWSKSNVGKIDAVENLTLSKTFNFDNNYRLKTNKFTLKFDYTLRNGLSTGVAGGSCTWNEQSFDLKPTEEIQSISKTVYGKRGQNILKFEGERVSIDNIRLIPEASTSSVLANGDFQSPQFSGDINDGIPSGWNTDQVQFAKSYYLSQSWPFSAGQSISLNKRQQFISQILTLSKDKKVVRPEFSYYTLSLDFAAINKDQIEQSKGEVYWNNKKVGTLKPTIEGINKFTVKIDAVYGSNSLNIKGVNEGIVVSNVKLVRYGSDENIVQNGNFTALGGNNQIANWEGNAKIDQSQDVSSTWKKTKVAVLTPEKGGSISQKFNFDGNLRFMTNKLILSFQYTVRQGVKFETAKAKVIWNDNIINLNPTDYDLHLYNEIVSARKGNNFLIFESDGIKRHFGIFAQGFTLDNAWIRQYGSSKNLLVNGGFQEPKVEGFDYGMFTNKVPGWTTQDIYVGVGYYFSRNWGETQIIQLDGNKQNAKIMQGIQFNNNFSAIQ